MKLSAAAAAISSILLLSACGAAEGSSLLDTGGSSPDGDIMSSAPADSGDGGGSVTASSDPATPRATTPPAGGSATSAPGGATGKQPPTGKAFVDPEGKYSMTIDPSWKIGTSLVKGAEGWTTGLPERTIPTTVAVLTEDFTGAAVGISLKQYMTISVRNTKKYGFTVLKSSTVGGFNSPALGVLEYEGRPNGAAKRRFLAIIDVNRTGAAVATLISGPTTFTKNRGAALPYMLTIKAN